MSTDNPLAEELRQRFKWRKVVAPRMWKPEDVGQELVGYYGGKSVRNGQYGEYSVIIVHVPMDGAYMLTGVRIAQLVDTAMIPIGHPIRIEWKGKTETAAGHMMKDYDVMVADGDAIAEEHLPEVRH